MKQFAVVFAGQGAQKPGMGLSLYEASPAARAVFDLAGDEVKRDCFEADAERLKETEVTQPAVYTMDVAAYCALCEGVKGFVPCAVAGFSLGEYAAFAAAGVFGPLMDGGFETGLALVRTRSRLMKEAGRYADGSPRGAMAAGMGAPEAVLALVERARAGEVLEAVNFNSPQQTVVAGDAAAVERFAAMAKEDRSLGVKAIPLAVSGAFHSPIMAPAGEGLAAALEGYAFRAPEVAVYVNVTGSGLLDSAAAAAGGLAQNDNAIGGKPTQSGDVSALVKDVMVRQIQSPVQWQRTIENIVAAGAEIIIEVGPGKTLTGLTKKIAPHVVALHVEDAETLAEVMDYWKGDRHE
ncbi:MAG: ACP S-malonyltransferase [Clostridiales Family XIII bacterium]|jgi:[acyl-carrier-protein] S-malonyltransferase|nr:ACP S-malonyltransferase [Clostridiales Family XIII bacterium]